MKGRTRPDVLEGRGAATRAAVLVVVVVIAAVGAATLPERLSDFSGRADENAALDYADREIAGGNSLVVDQEAVYRARATIPNVASYRVAVGPNVEGATDLTEPYIVSFLVYFLMPRRPRDSASWIICYGCDRSSLGRHSVVWADDRGISIIRRVP